MRDCMLQTVMRGLATIASLSTAAMAEASIKERTGWSERGVFVFGSLVLDFQRKVEAWGPIVSTLDDCSDASFYCARGEIVRLALPRSCAEADGMRVGISWAKGDVTTSVLASRYETSRVGDPHYLGSGETLLLGDPTRPYVVFIYDKAQGVFGIFYDADQKVDFARLFRKADLYSQVADGKLSAHYLFGKVTLDPFGLCEYAR